MIASSLVVGSGVRGLSYGVAGTILAWSSLGVRVIEPIEGSYPRPRADVGDFGAKLLCDTGSKGWVQQW